MRKLALMLFITVIPVEMSWCSKLYKCIIPRISSLMDQERNKSKPSTQLLTLLPPAVLLTDSLPAQINSTAKLSLPLSRMTQHFFPTLLKQLQGLQMSFRVGIIGKMCLVWSGLHPTQTRMGYRCQPLCNVMQSQYIFLLAFFCSVNSCWWHPKVGSCVPSGACCTQLGAADMQPAQICSSLLPDLWRTKALQLPKLILKEKPEKGLLKSQGSLSCQVCALLEQAGLFWLSQSTSPWGDALLGREKEILEGKERARKKSTRKVEGMGQRWIVADGSVASLHNISRMWHWDTDQGILLHIWKEGSVLGAVPIEENIVSVPRRSNQYISI